jgi:hypothetical protein
VWRMSFSPSKSVVMCILDTLCDIPAWLQIGPWNKNATSLEAILEAATKSTKLDDFGELSRPLFMKLYTTARAIGVQKSKAISSPFGGLLLNMLMKQRFIGRLKFIDYLKRHPKIEETRLQPPIFITGLTRTGTTFLHDMLGKHPSLRAHYTWEQVAAIPGTDEESIEKQEADRVKRFAANRSVFNFIGDHVMGIHFPHIHRVGYEETEECTIPCSIELPLSLWYIALMMFAAEDILPLGSMMHIHYIKKDYNSSLGKLKIVAMSIFVGC